MMKNQMTSWTRKGFKTLLSMPPTLRSVFPCAARIPPDQLVRPDLELIQDKICGIQENEAQVKSWTFSEKEFSVGGIKIR